ncbi:hypothetical protein SAMN03159488_04194 [Pseudomonas sp. NFIX10]|nr:hypothetical protein SAMN03159488_04194 [Pseudomonas sp. NFIX10]SFF06100.1 hypothetical protein SAMN03159367_02926 [Pseudomonas sp. NFACC06-1]
MTREDQRPEIVVRRWQWGDLNAGITSVRFSRPHILQQALAPGSPRRTPRSSSPHTVSTFNE